MKTQTLGNNLSVGAIGLGCMGMSEFYGATDDAQSEATIRHAIDLGVTLFDTADMYGVGRNEELLGRAIKGRRDAVVLARSSGSSARPTADSAASAAVRSTSRRPATPA